MWMSTASPVARAAGIGVSFTDIMKTMHWVIIGIIAMGLLSGSFGRNEKPAPPADAPGEFQRADVYNDLRLQVLKLKPADVGISPNSQEPLAVLMETGYPEAVVTLVCVADGSASLYFSNGGGIIGGGPHETVNRAARAFVASAKAFRDAFKPTTEYPLPGTDHVRFYLITASGVLAAPQAVEDDLGNMREPLSPLFHQGHGVIAALREIAPE